MTKILTVAIPTFNRSKLLDKQLEWLFRAIKGFESECEILVSDNCSTDETPDIIKKWQSVFSNVEFQYKRNSENIGAVRNIASCINTAKGKYVWTISDDDRIFDHTIAYILGVLDQHTNIALIILNFSKADAKTGTLIESCCFNIEKEEVSYNGKATFEHCLQESTGGVGLTTALVYRTDLAQLAIKSWILGLNNLAVQIYWTAFCASYGSVLVTKDNYLECMAGTHYFMQNPKLLVTLEYADIPEILLRIADIGYSNSFSRKMVFNSLMKFNWKVFFGALRRCPLIAIKAISRYLSYLYQSSVRSFSGLVFRKSLPQVKTP